MDSIYRGCFKQHTHAAITDSVNHKHKLSPQYSPMGKNWSMPTGPSIGAQQKSSSYTQYGINKKINTKQTITSRIISIDIIEKIEK